MLSRRGDRPSWRALVLLVMACACAPSVPRVPMIDTHHDDAAIDARAADVAVLDGRPAATDAAADRSTRDAGADVVESGAGGADGGAGDGARDFAADGAGDGAPVDSFTYDGAPPVEPRAGEVVIDELLVNPAGTDTNREWIEIANLTALAFDLRTLHVADASKDVAVDAGLLAPGALLVLGQSLDPAKNGGAPVDLAYGGTISLNNDGDSIAICLGPCASGQVLNRVVWDKDLGAAYDGHSAIVDPVSGAFCPADQSFMFGDAGAFGTPGAPNTPCPE